jgi:16S rRNA (guanine527-N7)-methyltransferase
MMQPTNILAEGLSCLNIYNEPLCGKLYSFFNEIELFNEALGLVGVKNTSRIQFETEVIVRHILDSLGPIALFKNQIAKCKHGNIRVADIGSGAGFPGIPLALTLPDVEFILVERMAKRASFLQNAAAVLNLKNVTIYNDELKTIARKNKFAFTIATCRAYHNIDDGLLSEMSSILTEYGTIMLYKGRLKQTEKELAACKTLSLYDIDVIAYNMLLGVREERNMVVLRKVKTNG